MLNILGKIREWLLEEETDPADDFRGKESAAESPEADGDPSPVTVLYLAKPADCRSGNGIADQIKQGRAVILDITDTREQDRQRIMDYIAGVNAARDGQIHRIRSGLFLVLPKGTGLKTL